MNDEAEEEEDVSPKKKAGTAAAAAVQTNDVNVVGVLFEAAKKLTK